MPNETAYPLYWPKGQKRTAPSARIADAPFSVTTEDYKTAYIRAHVIENKDPNVPVAVRRRTKAVTITVAVERLEDQLTRLNADHPILSTNLELRLNGQPRSGQKDPEDSGAAVYFTLKGKRTVLACDKWVRVADNVAALAAHIRAIRSVENYGVGTLEQAFRGYQAIEDYTSGIPWRRILGYKDGEHPDLIEVEKRFRARARDVHPDMTGESHLQMAQLNQAMSEARKELAT
jgi:hypothetical protein